ncbi:competence type IV pilus minor pilin ComGG [Bacillus sp. SG-1]|uniref:competence type IV pilus minor pilin ComGG n=1 Tax=Bacillus sp. SG-1 TaxID=161544 RepID=UPI0001544C33|nr:competence type IV pilus minor pilin ComGG [Bacillus sp. SG-1]EDL63565.1 shikimate kinase [Bacillus sp. SG-1]
MINEKGYILPMAMMLSIAILLFSVAASAIFVSRYSYLDVMEDGYKRESLILYSAHKLLKEENSVDGTFTYPAGVVRYEVKKEDQVTTLILSFETDNKSYEPVLVKYENATKEILVWE